LVKSVPDSTKVVFLLVLIAVLLPSGCGGSSGPSESDAATLIESETPALKVVCTNEGARRFFCNGKNRHRKRLKLMVTYSASGDTPPHIRCQSVDEAIFLVEEIPRGRACKGIAPAPKE
jgi:hypothetical protein